MRLLKTHVGIALLSMSLGGLSGCGQFFPPNGGGGGGGVGDYFYIANSDATISGFGVSTTGALTAVPNSPQKQGFIPGSLAISSNNTHLYAGANNVLVATGIFVFNIGTGGALTAGNNGTVLVTDIAPSAMAVDPTGKYLLAAGISNGGPALAIYAINSDGTLSPLSGSPVAIPLNLSGSPTLEQLTPTGLAITPNSSAVYVSIGQSGTFVFTFNTSGGLTLTNLVLAPGTSKGPAGTVTNAQGALLANATSSVLYVSETNVGLRALSIGTGGALKEIAGSPFTSKAGGAPLALAFDPTGDYLYAANGSAGSVTGYTVAASGALAENTAAGSPFAAGTIPQAFALDQSKKFLASVNSGGAPDLQVYSFDATTGGKLNPGANAATGNSTPAGAVAVVSTH